MSDSESDEYYDDEVAGYEDEDQEVYEEHPDDPPPGCDPAADAHFEEHHRRGLNEDGGIARMHEEVRLAA